MASPADLGVVRAMLADLRDSLVADGARTAGFLAADLDLETLEALMPERRDTPVRIPLPLIARADALIDPMEDRLELLAWSRPSRASIIRKALAIGLDNLEAEVLGKGGSDGQS